jgi:hypothetical protein
VSKSYLSRVTLNVEGVDYGIFESISAINGTSGTSKRATGGGGPIKARPGRQTMENVTLAKEYEPDLHAGEFRTLMTNRGWGRATASFQPISPSERSAIGEPVVVSGILERVQLSGGDANSDDEMMLEVELSLDGELG